MSDAMKAPPSSVAVKGGRTIGCSEGPSGGDRDAPFLERCKKLASDRLLGPAARMFRDQAGCPLHVAWTPCGALGWDGFEPVFCSETCPSEARSSMSGGRCAAFDHQRLLQMLTARDGSHGFLCPLDVRTIACKIVAGGRLLGIAFFQIDERHDCRSPAEIRKMRELLKFVVHDTVETVLAEVERGMIERMRDELETSRKVERGLRSTLHRMARAIDETTADPEAHEHADLVVNRMLEYADSLYCRPIGLAGFAERTGMNLSYLSHLFSVKMGMPFRTYLRRLRLDRARHLLSDPMQRISEVAYAVGYTDPNRFRLDFKSHTGLAPTKWRERFAADR
ncbi:MAG: helix-turn-helix transcriptional regulator [Akkermansiaceae bacterium]|nr:helix-turn-helix transcriptional regulator [Akkermansiaceae bacterium]